MYNSLKERSDNTHVLLKELIEITDKYRRRLDSDRHDVINEFLDSKHDNNSLVIKKLETKICAASIWHMFLIFCKQINEVIIEMT